MKKLMLCVLICTLLCGCYDNTAIDRCAHPLAVGYDENANGCTVTGIYYMPSSEEAAEAKTISIHAQSPGAAQNKHHAYSFESWSPNLLNTVVFGQTAVESGVYPFMDLLARAHMLSADILLCAYHGTAADLLTPSEGETADTLSAALAGVLQTSSRNNLLPQTNIAQAYTALLNGHSFLLPIVARENGLLHLQGSLLMAEGKAVATLLSEETACAVMLSGSVARGTVVFLHQGVQTTADCAFTCTARRTELANGSAHFSVTLTVQAMITEHASQAPTVLNSRTVLADLREALTKRITAFFARTHALGCDVTLLQPLRRPGDTPAPAFWQNCQTEITVQVAEKEG